MYTIKHRECVSKKMVWLKIRGEKMTFPKRKQARQWCRNHGYYDGLVIVHPDGKQENFTWNSAY